jgi:1,3-beta-glucan synthase
MAARPGYEQPDPRNPFAIPQQQSQFAQPYQQPRRDYDAESDMSDQYASRNGSTARLTGTSPYYDHSGGQYDAYSEYCCLVATVLSFRTDANLCL